MSSPPRKHTSPRIRTRFKSKDTSDTESSQSKSPETDNNFLRNRIQLKINLHEYTFSNGRKHFEGPVELYIDQKKILPSRITVFDINKLFQDLDHNLSPFIQE